MTRELSLFFLLALGKKSGRRIWKIIGRVVVVYVDRSWKFNSDVVPAALYFVYRSQRCFLVDTIWGRILEFWYSFWYFFFFFSKKFICITLLNHGRENFSYFSCTTFICPSSDSDVIYKIIQFTYCSASLYIKKINAMELTSRRIDQYVVIY